MEKKIRRVINEITTDLIKLHQKSPHIASSLSALETITTLYYDVMNINSTNDEERDRFILSKGHAISALYGVLNKKGLLEEPLENYAMNGSKLVSHPVRNYCSAIEASSGSLGHGLAIGVGIAYAAQLEDKKFKTFVLMGDGECQEGSVWEAAILAPRLKLDNLIIIIDANGLQDSEYSDKIQPLKTFKSKWEAFGWNVSECTDVVKELPLIIKKSELNNAPLAIIAYTVKGKGIKEIEGKLESHRYIVPKDKVDYLVKEVTKNEKSS